MLSNSDGSIVLSNLGWVDEGGLWVFNRDSRKFSIKLRSKAQWLSLIRGVENHFAVIQHYENGEIKISIHAFQNISEPLASASFTGEDVVFAGDKAAWSYAPHYFTAFVNLGTIPSFAMIYIDGRSESHNIDTLDWYDDSYDKLYQGISGVTEIPNSRYVLISVQRDSNPVLYDPLEKRIVRKVGLPGPGPFGNPRFYVREAVGELWAENYDTLVRLRLESLEVLDHVRIQGPPPNTSSKWRGRSRQFVGDFAFTADEALCLVPRPFLGDVVGVDTATLKITHRCLTGEQPIEVGSTGGNAYVARDWQTGKLITGELRPVPHE